MDGSDLAELLRGVDVAPVSEPKWLCLGPKCPCAGSLALKALIEAEVSYTLTSFASSRGHESLGYPDR